MTTKPHDVSDLFLAPVALELDRRLQRLSGRSAHELDLEIAVSTDQEPSAGSRDSLLLEALTHLLPLHGWEVSWDHRGLRLQHSGHELVLGVPGSVRAYLTGPTPARPRRG